MELDLTIAATVFLAVLAITIVGYVERSKTNAERAKRIAAMSPSERAEYEKNILAERAEHEEKILAKQAYYEKISLERQERARLSSLQRQYGDINPQFICPHCQHRGTVRTASINKKVGISGAKATAAIWTLRLSTLATGLSRKEAVTQAHCDNCDSLWSF